MTNAPFFYKKGEYDKKIKVEIAEKYYWIKDGKTIIKYAYFEQLANVLGIEVTNIQYPITPTGDNLQQHVCIVSLSYPDSPFNVKDFIGQGECSRLNTGNIAIVEGKEVYNERGDIGACYRASTAYTRAFDRAMKKALGLHFCFSSSEAKDFQAPGEDDFNF
jgi:hypothetical protein